MISVDTNILVRLVTGDDPTQAKKATQVLNGEPALVAKTVLLETEWVLRYSYGLNKGAILRSLLGILGLPAVEVEEELQVAKALEYYESGMDFADALHLAASQNAVKFVTFDRNLWRKARRLKTGVVVVCP